MVDIRSKYHHKNTLFSSVPNLHLQLLIFFFFSGDRIHISQYCLELIVYFVFMNIYQSFDLVNKNVNSCDNMHHTFQVALYITEEIIL